MDTLSRNHRSILMARVRTKRTAPEVTVRAALRQLGIRFKGNVNRLPGKPDLVLRDYRVVVFVNGCFWHSHHCPKGTRPTSNVLFWRRKLESNVRRDRENKRALRRLGWRTVVIWECQTKDNSLLKCYISRSLRGQSSSASR